VLVADEPGEIAFGALALPHFFVDVHQTGARHEALCDLIRQHLGLKEWMMGEDPHVPELVCDGRLELFLRQLVDEVLFDRQQKSSAGVGVLNRDHQRILRHQCDGDRIRHRQLRHELVDDLLNALLIPWIGNDALGLSCKRHGSGTWEQQQEQRECQNPP